MLGFAYALGFNGLAHGEKNLTFFSFHLPHLNQHQTGEYTLLQKTTKQNTPIKTLTKFTNSQIYQ
jgi:hypothetical protein